MKVFKIVAVIVLILAIIGAATWFIVKYWPSGETETSGGTKTHSNTKYGFKFSYPASWVLSPFKGDSDDGTFNGTPYRACRQINL